MNDRHAWPETDISHTGCQANVDRLLDYINTLKQQAALANTHADIDRRLIRKEERLRAMRIYGGVTAGAGAILLLGIIGVLGYLQ